MKFTVLGCGASLGTPNAGGFWGACDPAEPRNRRSRASLLVESATTTILIDTTYDLSHQLTRHHVKKIDAALLTHDHNDHVNGIDDLRPAAYHSQMKIPVYTNAETAAEIDRRWPFVFTDTRDVYQAFLEKKVIAEDESFRVGDIDIRAFGQDHHVCTSLGFRFGNFAYSADFVRLDEKALAALEGVEVWMVDAAGYKREVPSVHANLASVMGWVERLKPKMTYLTVLTSHMDYKTLCDELPPHVRPAYDGQEIVL